MAFPVMRTGIFSTVFPQSALPLIPGNSPLAAGAPLLYT